jgi:hypothetical protein
MTPINFMFAFKERIETIVSTYKMRESDSDKTRAPKVWLQNIPEKLWDEKPDPADYPFVQIVLGGGTLPENDINTIDVVVYAEGYDDGQPVADDNPYGVKDRQGWMIPTDLLWRIASDLKQNPRVGGMYDLQYPITWDLPPNQPAPFWGGAISLAFSIPMPTQDFGMQDWMTNPTLPFPDPSTEEVRT